MHSDPFEAFIHTIYASTYAYGRLSITDREEVAGDMCHSVNTQAQYQFIPKQRAPAKCEVQRDLNLDLVPRSQKSCSRISVSSLSNFILSTQCSNPRCK